jgi:abortive infection bacteriophage resistance protein
MASIPPKEFKHYHELIALLLGRGMSIDDQDRALRKLSQIGYYRLSGFWYPSRIIKRNDVGEVVICPIARKPTRSNNVQTGTTLSKVIELYLFDKKLRMLSLDALERIEVYIRSVVAHEVGRGKTKVPGTGNDSPDPLAWQDADYINPKHLVSRGMKASDWEQWLSNHDKLIQRSQEDCIKWHKLNDKDMPFWVVIEAWDFGTLSKYYGMLNNKYKIRISRRLGIRNASEANILVGWLKGMNNLRNRCAHHTRIWNQQNSSSIKFPNEAYFRDLNYDQDSMNRIFGLITAMWFLLHPICPSSKWIFEVISLIESFPSLPGCHIEAMGVPADGIPYGQFDMSKE